MEVDPSSGDTDQNKPLATFEYNNLLAEEAQATWFTEWFRLKQTEFETSSKIVANNNAYVKSLADLFKESYKVKIYLLFSLHENLWL